MSINLKQLSELLELSQTTVSRALNGFPEVSEATRDRVRRAAANHNYQPNRRATGLAMGKSRTIGHIIPVNSQHEVVNPIFAEFIAGAAKAYQQHGYEMLLSVANSEDEEKTYRTMVAKGAVDGVVIQLPRRDDNRVALLQDIDIPFVIHGRVSECTGDYAWIDVNNRRATKQAVRLLTDLGHRRIGFVNGNETLDFAWARRTGYLEALGELRIPENPQLMRSAELTENHGYVSAKDMLNLPDPPTAFYSASYVVALGITRAIHERGRKLGEDISVVIHDDELSYFDDAEDIPLYTGTRSSVKHAGTLAAEMLVQMIENPAKNPTNRLLKAQLVLGRSTGPVREVRG
jgi:LacI family transcriptional regulator